MLYAELYLLFLWYAALVSILAYLSLEMFLSNKIIDHFEILSKSVKDWVSKLF